MGTTTVIINIPAIANAGLNQLLCSDSQAQLNGLVSGGSITGIWSTLGSGFFSPHADNLDSRYTLSNSDTAAGKVNLILTSTNNGACPVHLKILLS